LNAYICVFAIPNEQAEQSTIGFQDDSSQTTIGGKLGQLWHPKHKTPKKHWGTTNLYKVESREREGGNAKKKT
jgi:hypothetical protein